MKIALFAPSDAYLFNFRGALAAALHEAGHEVLMVAPPGPFGARFEALGYRWCPAPMERAGMNPVKEVRLIAWLYRLFRRERVDLVHGFIIKGAVYGALSGRLAGVSGRVASITGMGYLFLHDSILNRCLRAVVKRLFRLAFSGRSVRVVVQNHDDLALFRDQGLVRLENLEMVPGSGVDCERFAPDTAVVDDEVTGGVGSGRVDAFRVLLPARLLWHKGLAEYLEASRRLKSEGRSVDCLLAGEPDDSNPTSVPQAEVEQWSSDGLIDWLGFVEDMPSLYRSVDAVVLPSYGEGLPKVLVEGAAAALPLVTTDVPGCREVVTDGEDGLLVPPRNSKALAAAIARLQDDPALRRRLGEAARDKALARFDARIVIQDFFRIYADLIPGFAAGPVTGSQPAQ
jgi:glycosyltransferase involved in cell wall biosynthesis